MGYSIFRNGSYAVDHFSSRGAEAIARFWEKHILTNGVDELLKKAGGYGKCPSSIYAELLQSSMF